MAIEVERRSFYWVVKGTAIIHREDGPAIEYNDGKRSWYYHNERIECNSQEEFERLINLKAFW